MKKSRMREPFHTLIYKASMGYNDSWSDVDQEVLEMFAELIVKECIVVIEQTNLVDDNPVENIKEHFGVE